MSRIHVWFLASAEPVRTDDGRAWLERRFRNPVLFPLPHFSTFFGWLRPLYAWLMARFAIPRLLLPGKEVRSRREALTHAAAEVGRLLGPRYACLAVLPDGDPSPDEAARQVGGRERVILVQAVPHAAGDAERATFLAAEAALRSSKAEVTHAPSALGEPGMVEALAETIREGAVGLRGERYGVLFCAQESGSNDEGLRKDVLDLVERVVAATRLHAPWRLGMVAAPGLRRPQGPPLEEAVKSLEKAGATSILAVAVALPTSSLADLDAALPRQGSRVVEAPDLGVRPTYVRALVTLVKRAEAEAGWSSSSAQG